MSEHLLPLNRRHWHWAIYNQLVVNVKLERSIGRGKALTKAQHPKLARLINRMAMECLRPQLRKTGGNITALY